MEGKDSFHFALCHFEQKLSVSGRERCVSNNLQNIAAVEDFAGNVRLACLRSGQILEKFLLGSQISQHRFCWQTNNQYSANRSDSVSVCVAWTDDALSVYSIATTDAGLVAKRFSEYNMDTLANLLQMTGEELQEAVSQSLQIVEFNNHTVTMLCGTQLVQVSVHQGHPIRLHNKFDITSQSQKVLRIQLIGEFLIAATDDGHLTFWLSQEKTRVAVVDLRLLEVPSLDVENTPFTSVTSNLQHLCVVSADHRVRVYNLNAYFHQNPHHLLVKSQANDSHTLGTKSAAALKVSSPQKPVVGSLSAWNSQIVTLPSRASNSKSRPWIQNIGLTSFAKASCSLQDFDKKPGSSGISSSTKRVTGFQKTTDAIALASPPSPARASTATSTVLNTTLCLPEGTSGMQLKGACCMQSTVYLWFDADEENGGGVVCVVDVEREQVLFHRLPAKSVVLLPDHTTKPVLLLTESVLYCISFGAPQEQIVSKLMLYDTASGADALCHLNQWDRCSIPLHTLEVGLKHRQLDTVAFFLKSRESVFGLPKSESSSPPSSPQEVKVTEHDLHYSQSDLQQLESAIELLTKTIRDIIGDKQSKQFAEQLLHITLEYLHKVTKNVVSKLQAAKLSALCTPQFEKDTELLLTKITDYVVDLRGHLKDTNARSSQGQALQRQLQHVELQPGSFGTSPAQRELIAVWDILDEKAAVVEGILSGQIPLLQAYLRDKYGSDTCDLGNIITVGLDEALAYLHEREMKYAESLFTNMGFDVVTKLRQICLYTPDKALREYLSAELQNRGQLTEEEIQMVDYVHKLETLYSCPSFEMAKILRTEDIECNWEHRFNLESVLPRSSRTLDIADGCGDITPCEDLNSETASYAHILLEWLRCWDGESRHRILLEQILGKKGAETGLKNQIPAAVVWSYLCSHLDLTRLLNWVRAQYPGHEADHSAPLWPYNQSISVEMLDQLKNCTEYVRDTVLNQLARRGIFCSSEQNNLESIVTRLGHCHAILQSPHPLEVATSQTNGVNLVDFHGHMIQMCMQQQLPQLMYFYLDYWSLCTSTTDLSEVSLAQTEVPPWVDMILHFRLAAHRHLDPASVFEASLSASQFVQNLTTSSIEDMIEGGLVGRALATLMYSPTKLQQKIEDPPAQMLEALKVFPRLRRALLSPSASEPSLQQDVNMYQLLQGNVNFDLTRLFGWQSVNTLASEDAPAELPHFSQEALVSRFSYTETLQYVYYLRQGRPCFAFCSFLLAQLQAGLKSLSSKRIQHACLKAHNLAIHHFHQPSIAAACAAFVELLGQDSTVLCLHVQAANQVFAHKSSQLVGSLEQRKQAEPHLERHIAYLLEGCLQNKKADLDQLIEQLEAAITWDIDKHKIKRTSFKATQYWLLAVMFCTHHQVALSTGFLLACVEEDDWFMFLMFAQLHQYPAEQVKSLLPQFPSLHLQEHLYYVVDNVQHEDQGPKRTDATVDEAPKQGRHIRAQLYAKIGVPGAVKETDGSSSDEGETVMPPDEHSVTNQQETDTMPDPHQFRDLFGLLFACQDTAQPWRAMCAAAVTLRNPVLGAVASCFQDAQPLACLCSWLIASLPDAPHRELIPKLPADLYKHSWSLQDLDAILGAILLHGTVSILLDGLQIFDPKCILIDFLEFYTTVQKYGDKEDCVDLAREFKTQYQQLTSPTTDESEEPEGLLSKDWLESTVLRLITDTLETCQSPWLMGRFLATLDQSGVARIFRKPDLSLLYRLHQIVASTSVRLNYVALTDPTSSAYQEECQRIMGVLMDSHLYQEVRVFAEVSRVQNAEVTVKQLCFELKELQQSGTWGRCDAQRDFWKHCQEIFQKHKVLPSVAAKFFQDQADTYQAASDKSHLYKLVYDWLVQDKSSEGATNRQQAFSQLWRSRIQEYLEMQQQPGLPDTAPSMKLPDRKMTRAQIRPSELLRCDLAKAEVTVKLSAEEQTVLDELVGQMLDRAELQEACQVAVHFDHFSQDLLIIVSSVKLALGHTRPESLDVPLKRLLASPRAHRTRQFSKTFVALPRTGSTMSLSSQLVQSEESEDQDYVLSTLQSLAQHCGSGKVCCNFVITVYKIAQILQREVQQIMEEDPFQVLHTLLAGNSSQKYILAKSLITASGLADAQVAGFLCDGIVEALQVYGGVTLPGHSSSRPRGLILDTPANPGSHCIGITGLVQLCEDPSVLGQRLLDTAVSLVSSNREASHKMLAVEVELLIYSHDCHTLACHMEGISAVLRAARTITNSLSQSEEYVLMVRLLTGVARYSEMTYIFDILKQQEQFELLFRKGIGKEDKLRLAILDYLKHYHPADTDAYTMVSLHFTMFREIAQMLEESAHRELNTLKGRSLENNPEIHSSLQTSLRYFSDAAENYANESCLRHAQICVRYARLVALQIHLLPHRTQVINLDREHLRSFALAHNKLYEVYIVCEAYGVHTLWPELLHKFVVQGGDFKYLQDFRAHVGLTSSLLTDTVDRYRAQSQTSKQSANNLKKLLSYCDNIQLTYRLASQLGFTDLVKDLLHGESGPYLKDTCAVAKTMAR